MAEEGNGKILAGSAPFTMSQVHDVFAGRTLSDFVCPGADAVAVARTFSLSNGVLTANASEALVLESPVSFGYETFALFAEVRYESAGFTDSGLQLVFDRREGDPVRPGLEYQLKTSSVGDGWGLPGCRIAREPGGTCESPNPAGYTRMRRIAEPVRKRGVWHKVSILKKGDHTVFFFDGRQVNSFRTDVSGEWRIGFQTKPYPRGAGAVSFRNVWVVGRAAGPEGKGPR